jgi:hypothetical protein
MLRPEDFDAEDPESAELDALRGRLQVGELEGAATLVQLLGSDEPSVICGAANALYNLALDATNADQLLPLGALPKLCGLLEHEDAAVKAAVGGVLMNVCATSALCRSELSVTRLLPALLKAIVAADVAAAEGIEEPEVRKNALGALNNLMLDEDAARSLREEGGIEILTELLREALSSDARLEDAASSLLRALQVDVRAGDAFIDADGLPVLVATVRSPNEELQVRLCCLIFELCEQVPNARHTLHKLKVVNAVLPLLESSAEEVQESAARAIEKLSRMPAAATAVRRQEGIPLLINLMSSADEGVELAALSALMNVAHSDPPAAAAIREADGLKPLVAFLTSANEAIQIAACTVLLGCSKNEVRTARQYPPRQLSRRGAERALTRCSAPVAPTVLCSRRVCSPVRSCRPTRRSSASSAPSSYSSRCSRPLAHATRRRRPSARWRTSPSTKTRRACCCASCPAA